MNFIKKLDIFYEKVQSEIEKFNGRIVCERGCSYCCEFTECHALPVEAANAVVFVNENFDRELKIQLWEKIESFRANYRRYIARGSFDIDPQFFGAWSSRIRMMKIPCPFLTNKNDCLIYSVRPLTCRTYISYSQEDCRCGTTPSIMQNNEFCQWLNQINAELQSINRMFLLKVNLHERKIYRSVLPLMLRLEDNEFITGVDEFNIFKVKR